MVTLQSKFRLASVVVATWFAGGDKYVEEFKDDKRDEQGTLTLVNGNIYVGEFRDGKYDGIGTLYAGNGSIRQSGIWKDHKFVGAVAKESNRLGPSATASV